MPDSWKDRRRALWGVILVALGGALLLDRLGWIDIAASGSWWPAIPIVLGVLRILTPESPRQIADGLTFVLLGIWFFACNGRWWQLSYSNGWPLVLVIFGAEMIVVELLERRKRFRDGEDRRAS